MTRYPDTALPQTDLRTQLARSVNIARQEDALASPYWPAYAVLSDAIARVVPPRAPLGSDISRATYLEQSEDMVGDVFRAAGEFAKEALRISNAGCLGDKPVDVDGLVDTLIDKLTEPMFAERYGILGAPDAEFGGAWVSIGNAKSAGRT